MFHIYLGPNGYGKTKALENKRDNLISSGVKEAEILFIESELLLMDEVTKDSKDSTKTMEFIITELLMNSSDYQKKKSEFEKAVNNVITSKSADLNKILEEVLSYNDSTRDSTKDFISITPEKEYKKLVSINSKDIKGKMGSGQRMQLILNLVKNYTCKKYIFIDEPEKYSHPTLLHKTAELLNSINDKGIDIYIATHSPKLLSMLDLDLEAINIINDSTHAIKHIDFDLAIKSVSFKCIGSMHDKEKSYFNKSSLLNNIKNIHYRDFLECLFTRKIYLIEGLSDKYFLYKVLKDNNVFYDDYVIFQAWGKFILPIFIEIFQQLNIDIVVYFDIDDETNPIHKEVNDYLRLYSYYSFNPNIEKEFKIPSKNDLPKVLEIFESLGSLKGKYII